MFSSENITVLLGFTLVLGASLLCEVTSDAEAQVGPSGIHESVAPEGPAEPGCKWLPPAPDWKRSQNPAQMCDQSDITESQCRLRKQVFTIEGRCAGDNCRYKPTHTLEKKEPCQFVSYEDESRKGDCRFSRSSLWKPPAPEKGRLCRERKEEEPLPEEKGCALPESCQFWNVRSCEGWQTWGNIGGGNPCLAPRDSQRDCLTALMGDTDCANYGDKTREDLMAEMRREMATCEACIRFYQGR